ncbi:MAG: putative PEP-CTERM system histidine kinase [Halioglobus sp.]|jgi:putative PEP-CTERM system histidine kinase
MTINIGMLSYLAGCLSFAVLTLLLSIAWRGRPFGGVLIAASSLSAIWAGTIVAGNMMSYPPVKLMQLTEVLRNAGWTFCLLQLIGLRFSGDQTLLGGTRWLPHFIAVLSAVLAALFLTPEILNYYNLSAQVHSDITFATWLGISVIGLLLLEQLFRNSSAGELWSIKYLCLGLGVIFAYDFFMYAEAMLFRQLSPELWQARGLANALATPLIAIAIARNTDWKLNIHVSRQVVFHSVTLLGAGFYLLLMSFAGYFLKYLGGTWGSVIQILFLVIAGMLLLAVLFSGRIRAQTRVFLSKHFFSYKYDYREQWQNFTRALAETEVDVPDGIVRAMAPLVSSSSGLLWGYSDDGRYPLLSHWQMQEPDIYPDMESLSKWLETTEWVINIDELNRDPDIYQNLQLPPEFASIANAWLIIPLTFGDKLHGVLLLIGSDLKNSINWEDRDLLKTAGRQAGSHLAQYQANNALVEARQFDAFNRLSAYVVHDLKNILAQQSLMVANAEKHKTNPDFVDDMISTVNNSVTRMTNLMEQMRSGVRGSEPILVNLGELLREVLATRANEQPTPSLDISSKDISIMANRERLHTVFCHLVKNAQEATDSSGQIKVLLRQSSNTAIVEIQDSGTGMSEDFVKHKLFKPFESTKGLTGMGIGAFEGREFIRSMGGDLRAESKPGEGSLFRIHLPCLDGKQIQRNDNWAGVK